MSGGQDKAAPPKPDPKHTTKFLKAFLGDGIFVLTKINPMGKGIDGKTFTSYEGPALTAWLATAHAQGWNLYYHVNPTDGTVTTKAGKHQVIAGTHLYVDVDPYAGEVFDSEQERIRKLAFNPPEGIPRPTWVIFSGGGYQLLWELDKPYPIDGDISKAEEYERYNIQLERAYKADNCHNADRILRLPGSVNFPNAKKIKRGQKPALAKAVDFYE